jgi:hypothetical protein
MALSVITYLDLGLGDILGQIADHDLALAYQPGALSGSWLVGVACSLWLLLNATSGCTGSGAVTDGSAASGAALGSIAALGRENLVKRLVELARHVGYWCASMKAGL